MAETVARQAGVVIAWEAAQSLVDTCQGRPSAYSGKERIQVHVIDFLCYWDVGRISRRMRLDRSDHDDLVVIRGDGEIRIAGVVRRSVQVIQAGRVHVTCYAQFRIGHVGKVHLPVSEPRTGSISDGIDQEDLPSLVQGNCRRLANAPGFGIPSERLVTFIRPGLLDDLLRTFNPGSGFQVIAESHPDLVVVILLRIAQEEQRIFVRGTVHLERSLYHRRVACVMAVPGKARLKDADRGRMGPVGILHDMVDVVHHRPLVWIAAEIHMGCTIRVSDDRRTVGIPFLT